MNYPFLMKVVQTLRHLLADCPNKRFWKVLFLGRMLFYYLKQVTLLCMFHYDTKIPALGHRFDIIVFGRHHREAAPLHRHTTLLFIQ
jgi:hypothetical protein